MNDFNDHHEPTPDFRATLRRDMLVAFRRERQFASTPAGGGRRAVTMIGLAAAAVITLAIGLVLGAGTGLASAEGVEARQREVIASNVAATRQFAGVRLDLARAKLDDQTHAFAKRLTSRASVDSAKAEVRDMEALVARIDDDVKASSDSAASGHAILKKIPMHNALSAFTCAAIALAPQGSPSPAPQAVAVPAPAAPPVTEPQQGIPTVDLPAATAGTAQSLGVVNGVREVAGGKLLVNDGGSRQLRLFDAALATSSVTLDSAPSALGSYPARRPRPIPLGAYRGDSSILADPQTRMIRVLDGSGRVARTVPLPIAPLDLSSTSYADDKGRLLFTGLRNWGAVSDSAPIIRVDLASGRVDTVAQLKYRDPRGAVATPMDSSGPMWLTFRDLFGESLVPGRDDWAIMSNGTVAVVRGNDYHIDWIHSDGTTGSAGKLPFDWSGWNDHLRKQADSASLLPRYALRGAAGTGGRGTAGRADTSTRYALQVLGQSVRRLSLLLGGVASTVMPDLDGNLWILPTASSPSASTQWVYDVVNSQGELFQRVRVPAGRAIAGFGKGGVVYLVSGDRVNGYQVERTRVVRR